MTWYSSYRVGVPVAKTCTVKAARRRVRFLNSRPSVGMASTWAIPVTRSPVRAYIRAGAVGVVK